MMPIAALIARARAIESRIAMMLIDGNLDYPVFYKMHRICVACTELREELQALDAAQPPGPADEPSLVQEAAS